MYGQRESALERPVDRRRLGKPGIGTIRLNACYEGDHTIIEIGDDGKGLDNRRHIAEQAIARGLVAEAEIGAMADAEIQKVIFDSGCSTAETVTAVSRHGVGMDVVRTLERVLDGLHRRGKSRVVSCHLRCVVEGGACEPHQPTTFGDGKAAEPVITDMGALGGRGPCR